MEAGGIDSAALAFQKPPCMNFEVFAKRKRPPRLATNAACNNRKRASRRSHTFPTQMSVRHSCNLRVKSRCSRRRKTIPRLVNFTIAITRRR